MLIGGILLVYNEQELTVCTVQGNSMLPTVTNGERLVLNPKKEIERFDLVVFDLEDRTILKRVIGLPGDDVAVIDGKLFVNKECYPETYLDREQCQEFENVDFKIHIPEGHYFMMGDNRDSSVDSREEGPIRANAIRGVVIYKMDQ